jgi:hypothetical protein
MTQHGAVEELLRAMSVLPGNNGFFGATDGTIGSINVLQRDMNVALGNWQANGDVMELRQMAQLLQVYGKLTDTKYEQIMEALDGEK